MEIRPFRGWRFRGRDGDVSVLLAPPYDVLSQADKDALLAREPDNIVGVDLPHVPPGEVGPDSAYEAAGRRLRGWIADGLLQRDPQPALYAYQQDFTWAGKAHRRRAMIAAVRLAEFGQGIWPHEKTFPGPKADRMKLNCATGMQISAVFGFYEDGEEAAERLYSAPPAEAATRGCLGGVQENLWPVTDEEAIAAVAASLAERPLFIADGHHRYTTALNYRRSLGQIEDDHPANYVMFVLAAMSDSGLIILPAHRVISGLRDLDLERLALAARRSMSFERVELGEEQVADADGFLRGFGRHAMALAAPDRDGRLVSFVAALKDASLMDQLAADHVPAWRQLDVSVLHRLLVDHYLAECKTNEMFIEYVPDGRAALAAAASGRADLVVFLQATPLQAVRQVALAGAVMPHKSTYFYPKPATGMVLYPLR